MHNNRFLIPSGTSPKYYSFFFNELPPKVCHLKSQEQSFRMMYINTVKATNNLGSFRTSYSVTIFLIHDIYQNHPQRKLLSFHLIQVLLGSDSCFHLCVVCKLCLNDTQNSWFSQVGKNLVQSSDAQQRKNLMKILMKTTSIRKAT